jgi:hypothetical protein
MRLIKYAGRWGSYSFPDQSNGDDNFLELVADTQRLPGVNGGYDKYRSAPANQAVGNVSAAWWLHKQNSDMSTLRAAVGAMAGWGKQRLFINVWEGSREDKRWTWARVNNLQMSENVQTRPDQQQKVQASFQVDEPGWKGGQKLIYLDEGHILDDGWYADGPLYLDEGHSLDTGLYFNPPKVDAMMTSGESVTVTNRGTRPAKAVLTIAARTIEEGFLGDGTHLGDDSYMDSATALVSSIHVTFSANGKTDAEWLWGDTLLPGEALIVDAETQTVKVNGRTDRSGYPAFQRLAGYGFIVVPPGDSTLTIRGGIPDTGCHVSLEYWDEFYTS